MKITQEEVVDRQTVLNIDLEDEDLNPYLDQGYRKVVQRTNIPGFRKGKAPRRIIEAYLGRESLLNEVLDTMLPEVTGLAIDEQKLDAAGLPRIELLDLSPLTFKATVPLVPTVELGPYRAIRIEAETKEVNDEDVEQHIDQLRHVEASWEPVERPVKMGDMVTMVVKGESEGDTIIDESDAVFILDEDGVIPFPGFSQNLEGMEKEGPKEFDLSVPEDHFDSNIAGKECHFSATVREIKERVLPELDDEFARGVGDGYDSLEDLTKSIREELETEAENETKQKYRDAVMDALLENATIEMPPLLVEHEIDHIEADRARILERANIRIDDYLKSIGKSEEEMRAELEKDALDKLNRTYVISKITELEGLEVSDEEVDARIQTLIPEGEEQSDRFQNDEGVKSSVLRMLVVEKAMDRLAVIAKGEAPPLDEGQSEEDEPVNSDVEQEDETQDESPEKEGGSDDQPA